MSNPKYKPARLATLPPTLDPAEYDISPETRKAQAERLAIRSRLKREYLLQYNDPNRHGLIVSEGRWAGIRGPQWGRCAAAGGASLGAAALPEQCLGPWPAPRPREQDCSRARPPWAGSVQSGEGRGEGLPHPAGAELWPDRFPPDELEKVTQLCRLHSVFLPGKWEQAACLRRIKSDQARDWPIQCRAL